jgi:hypothetical protein
LFALLAVRFGRVPKHEKDKIMREMQRANSTAQADALTAEIDNDEKIVSQVNDIILFPKHSNI